MGGETGTTESKKRKADSAPPDGYVCRLCSTPGHWIQVCPTKKTGDKKRQKKSDHVPVPGKDPSPEDIEEARKMQQIPPPKCFCGLPARLNRVKRSKEGGDSSRAIGKYFFFCSKKRDDETQCRFARPAEMELNKKKVGGGAAVSKKGDAKGRGGTDKADKKNNNSKQICKFFAKGSCKKGKNCEFSHDIEPKKTIDQKKDKGGKSLDDSAKKVPKQKEEDEDSSSDSSSVDSSSSDDSSNTSSDDSKSKEGENENTKDKNAEDEKDGSSEDSDDSSDDSDSDIENDEVF